MLFAVVSLKCSWPSVPSVTWLASKSILKQTAETPRDCKRTQSFWAYVAHLRFSSMFSPRFFNKPSTARPGMGARKVHGITVEWKCSSHRSQSPEFLTHKGCVLLIPHMDSSTSTMRRKDILYLCFCFYSTYSLTETISLGSSWIPSHLLHVFALSWPGCGRLLIPKDDHTQPSPCKGEPDAPGRLRAVLVVHEAPAWASGWAPAWSQLRGHPPPRPDGTDSGSNNKCLNSIAAKPVVAKQIPLQSDSTEDSLWAAVLLWIIPILYAFSFGSH